MKQLAILRHAKSDWGNVDLDDFDRPLNERGRQAAIRVGQELRHLDLHFDRILASPAVRVRQTLDGVGEGYGEPMEALFDSELYVADAGFWLTAISHLPERVGSALLVGHNPSLRELVSELAGDDEAGQRRRILSKFPTAALAIIEFEAERWEDVVPGSGEIVELILPRELD